MLLVRLRWLVRLVRVERVERRDGGWKALILIREGEWVCES